MESRNKIAAETTLVLCLDFLNGDRTEEQFVKAMERFSKAIREEFERCKNAKTT